MNKNEEKIIITTDFIKLDQCLKLANLVYSCGEAKILIAAGMILVNEEIETRRGRKVIPGDRVETPDRVLLITKEGPGRECF